MASQLILASLSLAFLCICQADLISDICSRTVRPSICTQTLRSDPRSRGADLKGLGQIAIDKSLTSTQDAVKVVSTAANKKIVDTCVKVFTDAIDDLNKSSQALKAGSKSDLQTYGAAAQTNVGTCDNEFGSSEPPQVKQANKRAQDTVSILLVVANKL